MKDTTLLFLVKKDGEKISEICLAMKKRGFGVGRWNGAGGKRLPEESIENATRREAQEEIGIIPRALIKVAELTFLFPDKPDWNQLVHTYFCEDWQGDPSESDEMKPEWFSVDNIPFESMWPDDIFWLPEVLMGSFIKAQFSFGEGDKILDQNIQIVLSL